MSWLFPTSPTGEMRRLTRLSSTGMALTFSLSAECGAEAAARAVAAHFDGFLLSAAGRDIRCIASAGPDPESQWWAIVCVPGMTHASPIGSDQELCEPVHLTAAAHQLFGHLRAAPDFRYALVGVEVDH